MPRTQTANLVQLSVPVSQPFQPPCLPVQFPLNGLVFWHTWPENGQAPDVQEGRSWQTLSIGMFGFHPGSVFMLGEGFATCRECISTGCAHGWGPHVF